MCTIWWLDTAAAPPDQFNSGRFSYSQTVRTIAASIVDDFSPSIASTSAAERRFPVSNTSKVPSPDLGEHRQLHRPVGFDDRRQPVLPIHQHPAGIEGDALMGDHPLPPPHRLRERANHRLGHRPVRGVRRQPLRGPAPA